MEISQNPEELPAGTAGHGGEALPGSIEESQRAEVYVRAQYESIPNNLEIYYQPARHFRPHIHDLLEVVYVLQGTLEIGIDEELYHMEKGDLALIFPGKIHHAQCFGDPDISAKMHLLVTLSLTGILAQKLSDTQPENPVIPAAQVDPDVIYCLRRLYREYGRDEKGVRLKEQPKAPDLSQKALEKAALEMERIAKQSYVMLILSRSLPKLHLVERPDESQADLVHQIVAYTAAHYREPMTLTDMAEHLYVSPYTVSRVFSSVFSTNFNGYLNDMRLDSACSMLHYSDKSVTEVSIDSGFESQRTFNRVFKDRMHMSPREYRKKMRAADLQEQT